MLAALLMAAMLPAGADGVTTTKPLSYLALGDSYTIGESVPESGRWPVQLATGLRAKGIAVADPRIVARTGWSTDELWSAMDGADLAPSYDLVSLLIGVNNQYRGWALDQYRGEFARLLKRSIDLAGGRPDRVFVLSIPDWGVTPFGQSSGRDRERIARELDAFNAEAAAQCKAAGVAFVDITAISREADPVGTSVAADGLHPSAQQYARWAHAALPVVARLASRP